MNKKLFGSILTLMTLVSSIALAEGKDTLIIAQGAEAKSMDLWHLMMYLHTEFS